MVNRKSFIAVAMAMVMCSSLMAISPPTHAQLQAQVDSLLSEHTIAASTYATYNNRYLLLLAEFDALAVNDCSVCAGAWSDLTAAQTAAYDLRENVIVMLGTLRAYIAAAQESLDLVPPDLEDAENNIWEAEDYLTLLNGGTLPGGGTHQGHLPELNSALDAFEAALAAYKDCRSRFCPIPEESPGC